MAFLDSNGPRVNQSSRSCVLRAPAESCKMDEPHRLIQFDVYAESNSVWSGNMGHCIQYQTALNPMLHLFRIPLF